MKAPKLLQQQPMKGPKVVDIKKRTISAPALRATGPSEIMAMRISPLGPVFGNELSNGSKLRTKRNAITHRAACRAGRRISEKKMPDIWARGVSAESASDGSPSLFRLYPVI